jgi:hypothetical protein
MLGMNVISMIWSNADYFDLKNQQVFPLKAGEIPQ